MPTKHNTSRDSEEQKKDTPGSEDRATHPARKRKSLGRNLSDMNLDLSVMGAGTNAVIGGDKPENPEARLAEISIDLIDTDPLQPRKKFSESSIDELAESIKVHGILEPLVVAEENGRYRIIAGERRYRAARKADLMILPVLIRKVDDAQKMQMSLIENLQREDLNPMDQARALHYLMSEHGLSQQQIAYSIGKSRSAVANIMRLTSLPKSVADQVSSGSLSLGHAKALVGLDDPETIVRLAAVVVEQGLSVRQTEELIRTNGGEITQESSPGTPKRTERSRTRSPFAEAQAQLQEALGTKVRIAGTESKGRITIEYASKEQLEDFFARLSPSHENTEV